MRRVLSLFLVPLLAIVMLGAGAPDEQQRFGRVGHKMMCVCGCGQILVECNHIGCPDSDRMIGELRDQLNGPNGNAADSLILNWFVAKYGATVLAAPIRGGFDTVAWVVPISVFLFAILGTGYLVRMWAARRHLAHPGGAAPASRVLDPGLRDRIRRDTEYR